MSVIGPVYAGRIQPLTCLDRYRIAAELFEKLLPGEIHTTSDQHRIFCEGRLAGPVWHESVDDEAMMLELTLDPTWGNGRGVFPMDMCLRTDFDLPRIFICVANRGELRSGIR